MFLLVVYPFWGSLNFLNLQLVLFVKFENICSDFFEYFLNLSLSLPLSVSLSLSLSVNTLMIQIPETLWTVLNFIRTL